MLLSDQTEAENQLYLKLFQAGLCLLQELYIILLNTNVQQTNWKLLKKLHLLRLIFLYYKILRWKKCMIFMHLLKK